MTTNNNTGRAGAVALVLAGAAALAYGIARWMVSGCCGSTEPPQDRYLLLGILAASASWVGAYLIFTAARDR